MPDAMSRFSRVAAAYVTSMGALYGQFLSFLAAAMILERRIDITQVRREKLYLTTS